ncbi:MAG TPA: glycoside hydrolase family 15 protein [Vicinamibacterales bacterium]
MTTTSVPRLDHGVIGNGRVLALVAPSTDIEWLCLPRFDSPSIFAALLDPVRGGRFGFESAAPVTSRSMRYRTNTNVLRTDVTAEDGQYTIFDFAPWMPGLLQTHAPLELHRLIVPTGGTPRIRVHFDPRPDYARQNPELVPVAAGVEVQAGTSRLHLRTNVPVPYVLNNRPIRLDGPVFFTLSWGRPPEADSVPAVEQARDITVRAWRSWVKSCLVPAFAPQAVLRSALCLKLHQSADTGAIIAAATTSIPEALDSVRTWDYRFCWLRDAAFVVEALRRLSQLAEGEAFVRFLRDVAEDGPLQPLYGVGGERMLTEETLDHLSGFAGARPVRIGNAAYMQQQHDLMGEMVLCLDTLMTDPRIVDDDQPGLMRLIERLVEHAIAVAPTEDTGIWEYRTQPRFYTFSQAMCWVAAHRGARLARMHGLDRQAERWQTWADEQQARVLREAYNVERGYFTQALNGTYPDASNLLLATLGFVDPKDPRFVSTVRAYERLLVDRGLMLRYRHDDDFGETTSAFSICSFWWVEALAMIGELERAMELFARLMTHASPLGLFSEDIDPATGMLLGNFPQAYTHVGLIHAAITIGELLDARDGHFRAWA